ncbi:MAG: alpha/beta hydrolase [Ruminococcaceae bacterium]|nr:alpha/beta hydrolase [Oscillospiraceae bacterium]
MAIKIIVGAVIGLTCLVLLIAYICFYKVFYSSNKTKKFKEEYPIPVGDIYEPFRDKMVLYIKKARELPHRELSIKSHDGLTLRGRYYEYSPEAPLEILFHGYRGSAERDLSGGINRCFKLGHSALIVDHRGSDTSDGNIITFGVNEHLDCINWVNYVVEQINPKAKIIITGISMGAATVIMASSKPLPKNVVGVLADCGYSKGEDIIKKVMRDMKLPDNLLFPFVRLGGRIFGKFDIDEASPIDALKNCRLPILFFHGSTDAYVPHDMSVQNFEACASSYKKLITIDGAGHGLCYPVDPEKYLSEMESFFSKVLK